MQSVARWTARAVTIFLLAMSTSSWAQTKDGSNDLNPKVVDFTELEYPTIARQALISGVVVVRVHLDDRGSVLSAEAIFGSKYLVPDSLENVKKWHFQPSPAKSTVVVYDFRVSSDLCAVPCRSHFSVRQPNFATITTFYHPLEKAQIDGIEYEQNLRLVDFAEFEYPRLARQMRTQDIVVVGIELDSHGKVVSSTPISGRDFLMRECLINAMKWHFGPTNVIKAVIVYDFKFGRGACADPCHSQFLVDPPNFATITVGGNLSWNP